MAYRQKTRMYSPCPMFKLYRNVWLELVLYWYFIKLIDYYSFSSRFYVATTINSLSTALFNCLPTVVQLPFAAPSLLRPDQLLTVIVPPPVYLFTANPFHPISFKTFIKTSPHTHRGIPAFLFAFFFLLFFFIFGAVIFTSFALENGIKPYFSYSLLFYLWPSNRCHEIPITFSLGTSKIFSSVFLKYPSILQNTIMVLPLLFYCCCCLSCNFSRKNKTKISQPKWQFNQQILFCATSDLIMAFFTFKKIVSITDCRCPKKYPLKRIFKLLSMS